ncbi:hydrolase [Actinoplanes sp. NBRC 101535]|nr:hydrolase [Actinoplanes sp. NBRC 101535]
MAAGVLVLGAAATLAAVDRWIDTYVDPMEDDVRNAGYVEKVVQVNDVGLSFVEGPDNGPPLVLLHAQHMDWYSYNLVLPALAASFHVYDVDYPGHGGTTVPDDYPMTANRIGADLGDFIDDVIGEPVFVTGNSSGGLLATWLAANRPRSVRAVVLEDPPLFTSEAGYPSPTLADRSFTTAADAVRDGTDDFLLYWIEASSAFFDKHVAPGSAWFLRQAITSYREAGPDRPVELGIVANDTVRQLLRGLDRYDPRFGAAFHDRTWNAGFDHAEALARIEAPTLLLQADTEFLPDGTLNGAMGPEDGKRAASLLRNGEYRVVNATHVIHLAEPELFVSLLEEFLLRESMPG